MRLVYARSHVTVRHVQPRQKGANARFAAWWYWLFGIFLIEAVIWLYALTLLGMWWLLWATADAALSEAGKHRALSPRWVPFMDAVKPRWPKPGQAAVTS